MKYLSRAEAIIVGNSPLKSRLKQNDCFCLLSTGQQELQRIIDKQIINKRIDGYIISQLSVSERVIVGRMEYL